MLTTKDVIYDFLYEKSNKKYTFADIRRELDLPKSTARYNLLELEDEGVISITKERAGIMNPMARFENWVQFIEEEDRDQDPENYDEDSDISDEDELEGPTDEIEVLEEQTTFNFDNKPSIEPPVNPQIDLEPTSLVAQETVFHPKINSKPQSSKLTNVGMGAIGATLIIGIFKYGKRGITWFFGNS